MLKSSTHLHKLSRALSRIETIASMMRDLKTEKLDQAQLARFIEEGADSLYAALNDAPDNEGKVPLLAPGHWSHDHF